MSTPRIRAVGYLRRSTDQQDRSLGDQRAAIELYARNAGIEILRFYTDDAISGTTSKRRSDFRDMVDLACGRERDFECILVYDVKRFGRMDNDETGYYRHLLRIHGVRVCYASEGFTETFADDLIRPVKQWQARQESKDLAKVVIRGCLSKFQSRGGGWWMVGVPPYGYDRRYEDAEGNFIFIVRNLRDRSKLQLDEKGNVQRTLPPGARLSISDQDRCRLVPSEPSRVATIRRVFFEFVENGLGCAGIARQLNQEDVPTARSAAWRPSPWPNRWRWATICHILCNPAYVGDIVWNRSTSGTFYRIGAGSALERAPHESATRRDNDPKDWLVMPNAHLPLIRRSVFARAQELLRSGAGLHRRLPLHREEPDFRVHYVLTGMLRCSVCSKNLWGASLPRWYWCRRRQAYCAKVYFCKKCSKSQQGPFGQNPAIRKRVIERVVTRRIIDWFRKRMERGGRQRIRALCKVQSQRIAVHIGGIVSKKDTVHDTQSMVNRTLEFIGELESQLADSDDAVRRVALRRCLGRAQVDVQRRTVTLWIRQLPIFGATVGGFATVKARLPSDKRTLLIGLKKRCRREYVAYDLAWHISHRPEHSAQLFLEIRGLLLALGHGLVEEFYQQFVSYSAGQHFASLKARKNYVLVYLELDPKSLDSPPPFFRDVTGLGTQTTGDVELRIGNSADLLASASLIRAAYLRVASPDNGPANAEAPIDDQADEADVPITLAQC